MYANEPNPILVTPDGGPNASLPVSFFLFLPNSQMHFFSQPLTTKSITYSPFSQSLYYFFMGS